MINLTSCERSDRVVLSKDEYNKLLDNTGPRYPKPFDLPGYDDFHDNNGILLGSDQHEYLVMHHKHNDEVTVHYVDCELCLTRKQQEREELNRLIISLKDSL